MTKPQNTKRPASREEELVTLIMEPLADLVETARLEILDRIQKVEDSVDIIARQIKRESASKS